MALSAKWNETSALSVAVTLMVFFLLLPETVLVELQTSRISELKGNLKISPAKCQLEISIHWKTNSSRFLKGKCLDENCEVRPTNIFIKPTTAR